MKSKVNYLLIVCCLWSCKSISKTELKSDCGNTFEIQYAKDGKYLLSQKERDKNYIIFYFENNFNDKVKISINQKDIYNNQVVTNAEKPDDYADMFIYKMNPGEMNFFLKGFSETSKTCFEIPLDTKYRIIYLFYYQNHWIIRFTNNQRII